MFINPVESSWHKGLNCLKWYPLSVYRPLEPLSHLQTVNYDAQIMGDSGQKWGKSAVYGAKGVSVVSGTI